jgi:hypothetical protein
VFVLEPGPDRAPDLFGHRYPVPVADVLERLMEGRLEADIQLP